MLVRRGTGRHIADNSADDYQIRHHQLRQCRTCDYSTTPRNGTPVNGNHLDQSLSFSQKNGNSLTWVLVALPVCPTSPLRLRDSAEPRPNLELASGNASEMPVSIPRSRSVIRHHQLLQCRTCDKGCHSSTIQPEAAAQAV